MVQRSPARALGLLVVFGIGCGDSPAGPIPDPGPGEPGVPAPPAAPVPPVAPAPSISQVGRIAFVSTRDGEEHIYLMNPDGTDLVRLARGAAPAWSPDGRTLAFHVSDGGSTEVRLIDADGSDERRLAGSGAFRPTWSPDGRRIAFARSSEIFAVNADGTDERLLLGLDTVRVWTGIGAFANIDAWLDQPAWSPDGRYLAVVAQEGWDPPVILIAGGDGSAPRRLIAPASGATTPSWSPFGSRLALARVDGSIGSIQVDGSGWRLHAFAGDSPDWSADATNIVYASFGPRGCAFDGNPCPTRIWVGDPRDDSRQQLVPDAVAPSVALYSDYDPAWSRAEQ